MQFSKNIFQKTVIRFVFIFCLISSASNAQNIRGFYVNGFSGILGNTTSENTLLNYIQGNGYNYIALYSLSGLNLTNSTVKNQLASFISRAKTIYGITQVGAATENYSFISQTILPYNQGRSTANEKFDVINFEFEFWVTSTISGQYCSKYLTPGGYSCDTAGAFAFAKNQFQQIDNLCAANGMISEVYFGWPNKGQMQWYAQRADRILLHAYRTSDADIYQYSKNRLSDAGSLNSSVKIISLFSSESSFMGPWLSSHPITQPYATYAGYLAAETATWKPYINLQGYHWFAYSYMPQTTSVVATVTANGPTTFCSGGSVLLTANTGTGQTYQWLKNSSNISGATNSSYTATTSGSYAVKVTKSGVTATSSSITVTVSTSIPTPTISASGPTTFCPGGSVTLTSSSSTGNRWSTNATTQSITVTSSGSYTVTVTSGTCSATSAPKVVSVTTTPPAPTISTSGSTSICPGTGISLISSATSVGGYVWSTGATTRTIIASTAGTYWVRTGTSTCYSQSSNLAVTQLTAPSTPVITASGSTNLGSGQSVTLTSPTATTYSWSNGATTKSITVNTAGSYRVTVYGSNGCGKLSNPVAVSTSSCTPPAVPTITSSSTTNIIVNGYSLTLTSSVAAGYLWSNGATTRSITLTGAGIFTVRAYNGPSCYSTSTPVTVYLIYTTRETVTENPVTEFISWPNPANEQVTVSFNCEKAQPCEINVCDLAGRVVMTNPFETVEGKNLYEMNTANLSRGIYFLRLSGENLSEQLRMIIE